MKKEVEKGLLRNRQETKRNEGASQKKSGAMAHAKALRWDPAWFIPEAARWPVPVWQRGGVCE